MRKIIGGRTVLLVGLILAGLSASPARAGLLYSQPPTVSLGYFNTYTASYVDSSYNYYLTYDNFTLPTNSTITGVNWQGMYLDYNSSTGNYTNGARNSTSWYIEVFDANLNLVTYQLISAANVSETYAGTGTFYNSSGTNSSVNYYNDSTQLSTGISLNANQTYYLAIFSVNTNLSTSDFWSWMSGYGGDGVSYQYNTYNGDTSQLTYDRTFSLYGPNAVPEPSSLALLTISLSCLAGYSWKRRLAVGSKPTDLAG